MMGVREGRVERGGAREGGEGGGKEREEAERER